MKKVFGIIAILSFLFLLGTVGSMDQDMISLRIGIIRTASGIASFWIFSWLAGWFDCSGSYNEDKESHHRCSRSKDGKREGSSK